MSLLDRYSRYQVWCLQRGIEPAPFEKWIREIAKIPESSHLGRG